MIWARVSRGSREESERKGDVREIKHSACELLASRAEHTSAHSGISVKDLEERNEREDLLHK